MAAKRSPATIDEYLGPFPKDTRIVLENIRRAIRNAAPDAIETISYGIPAFDLKNRHLVFFAGWKHHISIYPIPAGDEALQHEISQYKSKRQAEPLLTGDPRSGERVACIHWAAHRRREDQAVRASGFPEEGF